VELYGIAGMILALAAAVAVLNYGARRAREQYERQTGERRRIIQQLSNEGVGHGYIALFLNRFGFRNRQGNEFTEVQIKREYAELTFGSADSV